MTPRWPSLPTPLHGTKSGYKNHRTAGETPCPDCLTAYVAFHAYYRFKRGRQHHPAGCPGCGSVFPEHLCTWTGVRA